MQIKPATHQRPQSSQCPSIWDCLASRLKSTACSSPPLLQSFPDLLLISPCDNMLSNYLPMSLGLIPVSSINTRLCLRSLISLFTSLTVDGHPEVENDVASGRYDAHGICCCPLQAMSQDRVFPLVPMFAFRFV